MKKAVSVFLIILGLIIIIISNLELTGAVIGIGFKMNYLAFLGILLFILGIIILLTSAPLEEIVEDESLPQEQNNQQQTQASGNRKNKSFARKSAEAVYGLGRWFTRYLYYGFAAPAVSATVKTGKEVGREAAQGLTDGLKEYEHTWKMSQSYRKAAGINEGFKKKLNPFRHAEYAEKYRELHQVRNALRKLTGQRLSLAETYSQYEGANLEYKQLNKKLKELESARLNNDASRVTQIQEDIQNNIDPQKIQNYNSFQSIFRQIEDAKYEEKEAEKKHYLATSDQAARITSPIDYSNPQAAANYIRHGRQFDKAVKQYKKRKK